MVLMLLWLASWLLTNRLGLCLGRNTRDRVMLGEPKSPNHNEHNYALLLLPVAGYMAHVGRVGLKKHS